MRLSNTICLASTNRHKLEEFQALFAANNPELKVVGADSLLKNARNIAFAEIYETYAENAAAKARLCNQGTHYPSLGDDSGLECLALEGRPGVKSHRYASPKPRMSQDEANCEKLLQELKNSPVREARFVCTLALVIEGVLVHATGTLEGAIAEAPRGFNGFGYDPLFIPKGQSQTLAELSAQEKNKISHRAQALTKLMDLIKQKGITLAKP